jgi:hypothetical protein
VINQSESDKKCSDIFFYKAAHNKQLGKSGRRDTLRTLTDRQKTTEKPTLRKIKRGASQRTKPTLLHHI